MCWDEVSGRAERPCETALAGDSWKFIRLSYRPHDFEPGQVLATLGEDQGCPGQCSCQMLGDHLCLVRVVHVGPFTNLKGTQLKPILIRSFNYFKP